LWGAAWEGARLSARPLGSLISVAAPTTLAALPPTRWTHGAFSGVSPADGQTGSQQPW